MARKRYTPEQIISKLRAIEVHLAAGMTQAQAANREEISVHSYTFARVSAAIACDMPDFYQVGRTMMLELQEKGGRTKAMPLNHSAVEHLDAYMAQLGEDSGPLFRSVNRKRDGFTDLTAKCLVHGQAPL